MSPWRRQWILLGLGFLESLLLMLCHHLLLVLGQGGLIVVVLHGEFTLPLQTWHIMWLAATPPGSYATPTGFTLALTDTVHQRVSPKPHPLDSPFAHTYQQVSCKATPSGSYTTPIGLASTHHTHTHTTHTHTHTHWQGLATKLDHYPEGLITSWDYIMWLQQG